MGKSVKRLLALLLALMMCVSLLPATALAEGEETGTIRLAEEPKADGEGGAAAPAPEALPPAGDESQEIVASGQCGDDATWTLTDDGVLTISGTGDMWDFELNGSMPTWDENSSSVVSVVIEEGITSIGAHAFYGYVNLKNVSFPKSLSEIGDWSFYYCLQLPSITIPENVTHVGEYAFGYCRAIASVSIPKSVTEIGMYAFGCCPLLKIINVDPDNANYCSLDNVLFNKNQTLLIQCPGGKKGAYSIPEGVTQICDRAFWDSSLTSVAIPASLISIGNAAFSYCGNLQEISVDSRNQNYCSLDGVLFNKEQSILLQYPGGKSDAYAVPNGVTCIGDSAFRGAMFIPSVTIPGTVTEICDWAFQYCNNMSEVRFLGSAPQISGSAFLHVTATTYYPVEDNTWGKGLRQNYGGDLTWVPCLDDVPVPNPFSDVPEGKYYYVPVLWAYYHDPQITGGISETEFGPGLTCTREQIVTFLWKAMGAPEPTTTVNPFVDVPEGKWYYKPVLWAVEKGITGGVDATHFGVGKPCTREQAMTFLWKACGSPEPQNSQDPFQDVPANKYYYKPVLWAVENGITGGVDATHFGVGKPCTRGQIVTFLYKARDFLDA